MHHAETLKRMVETSRLRKMQVENQTPEQRTARERMALFPANAEVLFIAKDIWVVCSVVVSLLVNFNDEPITQQPVVRLEGRLCIFPGIPTLFQKMLDGITPFLPLPPINERPCRLQVYTA